MRWTQEIFGRQKSIRLDVYLDIRHGVKEIAKGNALIIFGEPQGRWYHLLKSQSWSEKESWDVEMIISDWSITRFG